MQSMIDRAKPGETIVVPSDLYEGPIVITKSLTIKPEGDVRIAAKGEQPALLIHASQVEVSGLTIIDPRNNPEQVVVLLKGFNNKLRNLKISTRGIGLKLEGASGSILEDIRIEGTADPQAGDTSFMNQGNGIDLFDSHDNVIRGAFLLGVQDGIYLEKSHRNEIADSRVENSRYAIHVMYAEDTDIRRNESVRNVTGAMVMEADRTEINGNRFIKSSDNVHSQGILLYEAANSVVTGNRIEGNRVGLYVEQSASNDISDNQLLHNFVGAQLSSSENNRLFRNDFISNVIQVQAEDSHNNQLRENFWDDHQGIDFSGSGRSDLPYKADPFFLTVTNAIPSLQILFNAPGMFVLESMFQNDTGNWMTDESPLMRPVHPPPSSDESQPSALWVSCILFLAGAVPFFRKGVKRI
ncbi:ABC transporter substrate-binding protein [Effusibacillus lacus]|uniref:ABC transporter substrate-binding protein n=1 Tax=Effusibacillus lacus TaxID=1348429 RepID=A0A292YL00_9BACL|nr:ABC transporter substrate-binding protein [Effusibacillus lacus]